MSTSAPQGGNELGPAMGPQVTAQAPENAQASTNTELAPPPLPQGSQQAQAATDAGPGQGLQVGEADVHPVSSAEELFDAVWRDGRDIEIRENIDLREATPTSHWALPVFDYQDADDFYKNRPALLHLSGTRSIRVRTFIIHIHQFCCERDCSGAVGDCSNASVYSLV